MANLSVVTVCRARPLPILVVEEYHVVTLPCPIMVPDLHGLDWKVHGATPVSYSVSTVTATDKIQSNFVFRLHLLTVGCAAAIVTLLVARSSHGITSTAVASSVQIFPFEAADATELRFGSTEERGHDKRVLWAQIIRGQVACPIT